ncbi:MAG TPA: hypothetical protein VH597_15325 [Verrucomicrobiae bacterium]|nr:hypothetical protein [Verrucomicrobiae bacterium]
MNDLLTGHLVPSKIISSTIPIAVELIFREFKPTKSIPTLRVLWEFRCVGPDLSPEPAIALCFGQNLPGGGNRREPPEGGTTNGVTVQIRPLPDASKRNA